MLLRIPHRRPLLRTISVDRTFCADNFQAKGHQQDTPQSHPDVAYNDRFPFGASNGHI